MVRYAGSFLKGKFVLGPMAGYTDIAFRLLCKKHGAAMCFTEFSNATALVRNVPESWRIINTCNEEMPVGIQIFGSDEKIMAKAVELICERVSEGKLSASCIDLNFGCPSGSVIRSGAGSALLRKPEKMAAIVAACVAASELPITAKIRAGWSSDNSLVIAQAIEKAGACGITIHWRTATEGRKRQKGWEILRQAKDTLSIPVIGNGGASNPELAVRFLNESECDAVMISSAALGNPRIFSGANAILDGKKTASDNWNEKKEDYLEYASLAEKYGVLCEKRLRLHAQEFLTGQRGVKIARKKLNEAKSIDEINAVIDSFSPYSNSSDMKT